MWWVRVPQGKTLISQVNSWSANDEGTHECSTSRCLVTDVWRVVLDGWWTKLWALPNKEDDWRYHLLAWYVPAATVFFCSFLGAKMYHMDPVDVNAWPRLDMCFFFLGHLNLNAQPDRCQVLGHVGQQNCRCWSSMDLWSINTPAGHLTSEVLKSPYASSFCAMIVGSCLGKATYYNGN